jgi:predicted nucleic acid-binding protein
VRRYLLDTAVLSAYLQGRRIAQEILIPWIEADEVVTNILAYGEVLEYLKGSPTFATRHIQLLDLLNEVIEPYFLSYEILERYADIRRGMRPPRGDGLIGDMDTLIAATALVHGLTVVTSDDHFERVPDLRVQLVPRDSLRLS